MRRQLSAALIAVATLTTSAVAAERNYTIRGEGWFDTGNPRFGRVPMREARLTLRDNGEFAVTLFVRNQRYLVRGRWDRNGRSNLERIDIDDAFGQRARGNGTLAYRSRGGQPVRLELDGRTNEGTFRANIEDADAGGWERDRDDRRDGFELGRRDRLSRAIHASVSGEGLLRLSGIRDGRLDHVRVRMNPNGDVRLEFAAPTRGVVHADIVQVRGNRVTARVREVFGRRASGELVVVMRSGDMVDHIRGSGNSERGGWQLDFEGRDRDRR
jgi:hypothetical protein